MMHVFKNAWAGMFRPILQRPKRVQVAALCHRKSAGGKEVLLITSRDTGRWIVPKGWPIDGLDGAGAALQEAWEEAGVKRAEIIREPIGMYEYDKDLGEGLSTPVVTSVYAAEVQELSADYPEVAERTRAWYSQQMAADLVDEPELKAILRAF